MNKHLVRAICFLLVPCLIVDPGLASGLVADHARSTPASSCQPLLTREALISRLVWQRLPKDSGGRLLKTRWIGRVRERLPTLAGVSAAGVLTYYNFTFPGSIALITPYLLSGRLDTSILLAIAQWSRRFWWGPDDAVFAEEAARRYAAWDSWQPLQLVLLPLVEMTLVFAFRSWVTRRMEAYGPTPLNSFLQSFAAAALGVVIARPLIDLWWIYTGSSPVYPIGFAWAWHLDNLGRSPLPGQFWQTALISSAFLLTSSLIVFGGVKLFDKRTHKSRKAKQRAILKDEKKADRQSRRQKRIEEEQQRQTAARANADLQRVQDIERTRQRTAAERKRQDESDIATAQVKEFDSLFAQAQSLRQKAAIGEARYEDIHALLTRMDQLLVTARQAVLQERLQPADVEDRAGQAARLRAALIGEKRRLRRILQSAEDWLNAGDADYANTLLEPYSGREAETIRSRASAVQHARDIRRIQGVHAKNRDRLERLESRMRSAQHRLFFALSGRLGAVDLGIQQLQDLVATLQRQRADLERQEFELRLVRQRDTAVEAIAAAERSREAKNWKLAVKLFEGLLESSRHNHPTYQLLAYLGLARAYHELGKQRLALSTMDAARKMALRPEMDPEDAQQALMDRAKLLRDRSMTKEALDQLAELHRWIGAISPDRISPAVRGEWFAELHAEREKLETFAWSNKEFALELAWDRYRQSDWVGSMRIATIAGGPRGAALKVLAELRRTEPPKIIERLKPVLNGFCDWLKQELPIAGNALNEARRKGTFDWLEMTVMTVRLFQVPLHKRINEEPLIRREAVEWFTYLAEVSDLNQKPTSAAVFRDVAVKLPPHIDQDQKEHGFAPVEILLTIAATNIMAIGLQIDWVSVLAVLLLVGLIKMFAPAIRRLLLRGLHALRSIGGAPAAVESAAALSDAGHSEFLKPIRYSLLAESEILYARRRIAAEMVELLIQNDGWKADPLMRQRILGFFEGRRTLRDTIKTIKGIPQTLLSAAFIATEVAEWHREEVQFFGLFSDANAVFEYLRSAERRPMKNVAKGFSKPELAERMLTRAVVEFRYLQLTLDRTPAAPIRLVKGNRGFALPGLLGAMGFGSAIGAASGALLTDTLGGLFVLPVLSGLVASLFFAPHPFVFLRAA